MKEEFYAAIKLVSGEEIFAQVTPSEEEDRTLLILDTPVIFETIQLKHMAVNAIKVCSSFFVYRLFHQQCRTSLMHL